MPRGTRKNDQWLKALEGLQDSTDPTSNMYMVYGNAIRSLKGQTEEYMDVDSLSAVKFIGKTIIAKLKDAIQSPELRPSGRELPSSSKQRKRKLDTASSTGQSQKRDRKSKKTQNSIEETASNQTFHSGENTIIPYQPEETASTTKAAYRSYTTAYINPTPSFEYLPNTTQYQVEQQTRQQTSSISSLERHSFPEFYYLDNANNPVKQSDLAILDIAEQRVWLKVRLCARRIIPEHPILPHLRNGPPPDKWGSDDTFVCWLAEDVVEHFDLKNAPGIRPKEYSSNITAVPPNGLGHVSSNPDLQDLLSSEKRGKNIRTLDPSRKPTTGKQWEVSSLKTKVNSTSIPPHSGELVSKKSDSCNAQTLAWSSSQPSIPTAPSQPSLRRAVTLPDQGSISEKQNLTAASHATKRKNRGRVSDFVPAPPPVDDFDRHLDIIAASQNSQSDAPKAGSSSYISADMMEDVADLTIGSQSFAPFDPILFPAGSFDIVLILDNRERAYEDRDYIFTELQEKGVSVEQRALVLGDVLWIARRKVPLPNAANECVLGYILERKRLDDLCQSIIGGRFHEQKFRLSNTGLKVFYLIEDYNSGEQREKWAAQIDTARSSVQIIDGFILKETRALRHTIEYFSLMHTIITNTYQDKTLRVIPPELVKRYSYLAFQKHLRETDPTADYMVSYNCFEKLNHKSNNLTSRDLFAQMLLCIKGVSAEKASVIIRYFPTLRSLWDAFREAEMVERTAKTSGIRARNKIPKAAHILCDLEGRGRKKIGPALSESIYKILRANEYDATSYE